MIVIANVFPQLQTAKEFVKPLFRKRRFRTSFIVNVLMGAKQLWTLHESTFIKFFDHSEGKWFAKYLAQLNLKS